jgi:HD superfamily phosphohydrolase YqeK
VEQLRKAVEGDLDRAVLLGLEMTVDTLRSQGRRVAQNSLDAISWLQTAGA